MTLQLRVTTSVHFDSHKGGPWGVFIWGQGRWGDGLAHDVITDSEPATIALSKFGLAAYPYATQSRPWGTFVWGVDGWGIPAVSSTIIASGEPVKKVTTAVEGS